MYRSTAGVFLALALTTYVAPLAFPQLTSGNLVGTVYDPSGAAIPDVKVQATNMATNVSASTTSNSAGQYRFDNLPVGRYRISASAARFTTTTINDIPVELNRTGTVNVTLQIGSATTTIDVVAAPPIDTTTAEVTNTYDTKLAQDLPSASFASQGGVLFGAYNLALLNANVASSGGIGQGRGPSVGGQRPTNNNFQVEGIDNNDTSVTGPLVYVPNEATQEFTLLANQFSPEFGQSSGGQFNIVVKSGSNAYHGSVYDYLQNRNLNAVDQQFARQGSLENPRYDQNRLGGSVGGPIKHNRLFFFANFEAIPLGNASTVTTGTLSPTAAGYQTLSQVGGLSSTNLGILQKYLPAAPAGNGQSILVGGQSIPVGIVPTIGAAWQNQYVGVGSVDYTISTNDQLRVRYIHNELELINNAANLPAFFTSITSRGLVSTISEYHNFSASVTNELRLGYNRYVQDYPSGDFQYPGLDVFPNVSIDELNLQIGPQPETPQSSVSNMYQLTDNVSWTRGSHSFKFGYDGRRLIAPQTFVQRSRGDYEYSNLDLFLRDVSPDVLAERSLGIAPYSGDQWRQYLYANDNWKLNSHLTLNLGLRYEYITVPQGLKLQALNQAASVPGVLNFTEPKAQTNNWAPRVGFAYSPGNSARTSIRAGFGMAYDVLYDNLNVLSLPPQFNTTVDVPLTAAQPNFLGQGGITPGERGPVLTPADARSQTSTFVPAVLKRPYSINWNFGVQHVIHNNWTVEARYIGTRGVHLPVQTHLNDITKITPTNSLPTFMSAPAAGQLAGLPTLADVIFNPNNLAPYGFDSYITGFLPLGNSIYHGLGLQVNHRFSNGFQMQAAYTWSHNIDDSTASLFSTLLTPRRPQDYNNFTAERASSALDRRHRLTITPLWEFPLFRDSSNWMMKNLLGNWTFAGTYTFESPEYATVQSGIDSNLNDDSAGDRAIINPAGAANTSSDVYAVDAMGQKVDLGADNTVAYVAVNPNARYIRAGYGAYANGGRNTLKLPYINNFDISAMKRFNFTERMGIELRSDAYNVFNHPQYLPGAVNNIDLTQNTDTRSYLTPGNPLFAQWDQVYSSNPRVVQVTARFFF